MSSPQTYGEFKGLKRGARRREAARKFLKSHPGIRARVSKRAGVTLSMVSKVLQGSAPSVPVEQAIEAEERKVA